MRHEKRKIATILTATALLAGGSTTVERSEWTPYIPLPAAQILDMQSQGVQTTSGERCFIDMRHTLHGQQVTAVRGYLGDMACRKGDHLLASQLPDNYDRILDGRRFNWEKFLSWMKPIIQGGRREPEYIREPITLKRIGHQDTEVRLHDGTRGLYGPDECVAGTRDTDPNALPMYMNRLGSLSFRDGAYELAEITTSELGSTACKKGDIVLFRTGPVYSI